jgi:calcineurin-like phosphoesterase family protein
MSTTVWLISDTHFDHANILNFKKDNGQPMRQFCSVDDMNWTIINRWNKLVQPNDHVYHLGDVAMKKSGVELMMHCNGKHRLVRGNHDIAGDTKYYMRFFQEIYGVRVFDDLILSHIPLHPESVKDKWVNVHGHIHNNKPPHHFGPKYFNLSCEYTNYTPVTLEQVRKAIKGGKYIVEEAWHAH